MQICTKQCGWVGDSFMIPTDIFRAYLHEYTSFFCDFVYGVINIDLVCGSVGYFVFMQIRTIYLCSTCVLSLSLSSLKSVSELLISIYFHTRIKLVINKIIFNWIHPKVLNSRTFISYHVLC